MATTAVLMTCHNRREKTKACLASLKNQDLPAGLSLDLWLVDDGSSDGTADMVRETWRDAHLLEDPPQRDGNDVGMGDGAGQKTALGHTSVRHRRHLDLIAMTSHENGAQLVVAQFNPNEPSILPWHNCSRLLNY